VTVCIDKVSVESLLIYQNLNNATPEFYVVYNQEEVPTSLYPYKFKFDIQTNGVYASHYDFSVGFRSNWIQRNRNSSTGLI
jgi:hypothetical protein